MAPVPSATQAIDCRRRTQMMSDALRPLRIGFIGCVEFSYHLLEHLIARKADIAGIVTRSASPNADFRSLLPLAEAQAIPSRIDDRNDQAEVARWLRTLRVDVVYCFGWPRILGNDLLTCSPIGVVGYHPTALPRNRGRHPIIWALALGLTETASTFFLLDRGADSGPILDQETVSIGPDDDAGRLYARLVHVAIQQVDVLTASLASGEYRAVPQNHQLANYWRKRTVADGQIDWRMSARSIHNTVRALSPPYPGAHCRWQGRDAKIWRTRLIEVSATDNNREPGAVLGSTSKEVTVKCGEGAIELVEHDLDPLPQPGEYL
jgi:methionyl-tRNA formyltransferase